MRIMHETVESYEFWDIWDEYSSIGILGQPLPLVIHNKQILSFKHSFFWMAHFLKSVHVLNTESISPVEQPAIISTGTLFTWPSSPEKHPIGAKRWIILNGWKNRAYQMSTARSNKGYTKSPWFRVFDGMFSRRMIHFEAKHEQFLSEEWMKWWMHPERLKSHKSREANEITSWVPRS